VRLSISFTYLLAYLDSAAKRRVHTGGFNLLFWRHNFFFPFLQFTLHYIHSHANIDRLQRVQNVLARVVAQAPLTISSVHIRHWLPVNHRISYKLSLLTWKVLHTAEPSYLYEFSLLMFQLKPYVPPILAYLQYQLALQVSFPHVLFLLLHRRRGTPYLYIFTL